MQTNGQMNSYNVADLEQQSLTGRSPQNNRQKDDDDGLVEKPYHHAESNKYEYKVIFLKIVQISLVIKFLFHQFH